MRRRHPGDRAATGEVPAGIERHRLAGAAAAGGEAEAVQHRLRRQLVIGGAAQPPVAERQGGADDALRAGGAAEPALPPFAGHLVGELHRAQRQRHAEPGGGQRRAVAVLGEAQRQLGLDAAAAQRQPAIGLQAGEAAELAHVGRGVGAGGAAMLGERQGEVGAADPPRRAGGDRHAWPLLAAIRLP